MLKIKRIHIKNFRSILNWSLDVKKMNVLVGLNDVGKSNVLKALNLFFNGKTEPGAEFDFNTDFSKYASVGKNKAKEITISITFEIPKHYKDNDDVEWTKIWRAGGLHFDSKQELEFSPYSKVPTLLSRVRYKYVPAVKSDNYFKQLLADLYESIAVEAHGGLTEKSKEYSEALKDFTQGIGLKVEKVIGIKSDLIMPPNQIDIFRELVFMTDDANGNSISLSYRGDGIKAIHIPAILKYISEFDNRVLGPSAVPITSIWGYEEPENGIEMKKCFNLADELYSYSSEVQMLLTTHSPGFYLLGEKEGARVFFVYKNANDSTSMITSEIEPYDIHDKVGIMPLIAPLLMEKENEIKKIKSVLNSCKFADRQTIFVEGITDKAYLEMAINEFSPVLRSKLDDGMLQIVTREVNGCGTQVLEDWSIVWIHMNYTNKAVFLFDADKTGRDSQKAVNDIIKSYNKKNAKIKAMLLVPTDEMKVINKRINAALNFSVEHLLAYDLWDKIIEKGWVTPIDCHEIIATFKNVFDAEASLNEIIRTYVNNPRMEKTILKYSPDKKDKILKLVRSEVDGGNKTVLEGFKNTITELEKYLSMEERKDNI